MANPHGETVQEAFAPTLRLLVKSGVPDAAISEKLFELAKTYAVPRDHGDKQAIAGWYAQLRRYRNLLDTQIKKIENALDNSHQD